MTRERQNHTQIIDRIIEDGTSHEFVSIVHNTPHTTVYKVDGAEPYAVRASAIKPPDHSTRMRMLRELGSLGDRFAPILHSEDRVVGGQKLTFDIMPFLSGTALDRFPSSEEIPQIIETIYALHQGLKRVSPGFQASGVPCLADVFSSLLATAKPGMMRSRAESLLQDERVNQLLVSEDQCLLYGDPWPANVLIERENDPIHVRIVDIDPLLIGPAILQPALLFSAYFVTSSVLYQCEGRHPDLDTLIQAWPEDLNRKDIVKMMRVYPILLSLVKQTQSAADPQANTQLLDTNLQLLERCLGLIDTYD